MTGRLRTPVLLIVFKRPDVTRRALETIRAVRPRELFVVADGPRPNHPEERQLCKHVRALVDEVVDWPCRIERRYAERNLGLEANVELGLDWVFDQVGRAIIMEDDCVPDPTFFSYCEQLLDRYADDKRVWQVAGNNEGVPESMFEGCSYAFSTWASVWGWATWADRWHAHRAVFDRDHAGAENRFDQRPRTAPARRAVPAAFHPGALVTSAGTRHFTQVARESNGDLRGWDHHWWVTIISEGGLSAVPVINVVENDGYGEGATHTGAAKQPLPARSLSMPLVHPESVALNRAVEAEMELILLRIDGRLSRWARQLIRPLWLRAIVRRAITVPAVWRLVRQLVAR